MNSQEEKVGGIDKPDKAEADNTHIRLDMEKAVSNLPPKNLQKRNIMMKGKLNFIAVAVCVLWVVRAVTDCALGHYEESQYLDQTFFVSGRAQVSLETVNDGIKIRRSDRAK